MKKLDSRYRVSPRCDGLAYQIVDRPDDLCLRSLDGGLLDDGETRGQDSGASLRPRFHRSIRTSSPAMNGIALEAIVLRGQVRSGHVEPV